MMARVLRGAPVILAPDRLALRAAYAVDVPRIVRAEVERALKHSNSAFVDGRGGELNDDDRAYLAARFPEAAPGMKAGDELRAMRGPGIVPIPSAPAEECKHPHCAVVTPHTHQHDRAQLLSPTPRVRCSYGHPDLEDVLCDRDAGHTGSCSFECVYSPAERDFLRALAVERVLRLGSESSGGWGLGEEDVFDAARRVVEAAPDTHAATGWSRCSQCGVYHPWVSGECPMARADREVRATATPVREEMRDSKAWLVSMGAPPKAVDRFLAAHFPEATPRSPDTLVGADDLTWMNPPATARASVFAGRPVPSKTCFPWCSLNSPGHAGECER